MDTPLIELHIEWDGGPSAQLGLSALRSYPPRPQIVDGGLVWVGAYTRLKSLTVESLIFEGFPSLMFERLPSFEATSAIFEQFSRIVLGANGGKFPPGAGRIVLAMPLTFAMRPWERILGERFLLKNAVFLRRVSISSVEPYIAPLRFPFAVAVVADHYHPVVGPEWVNLLFDDYVQRHLGTGIVTRAAPDSAIIWHLIGDDLGMLQHLLFQYAAPRLIVLQRSQQLLPSDVVTIERAFEHGASAVLVTSAPEPNAQAFSRSFYRKVFHNQPLEKCAAIAIRESEVPQEQVMFFAKTAGELSLLLTRVPLEMALAGPEGAGLRSNAFRTSSQTYLEAAAQERPAPTREQRATQEMLAAAVEALRNQRFQSIDDAMQHLYGLDFATEKHDVQEVKEVSDFLANSIVEEFTFLMDQSAASAPVRYTNLTLLDSKTSNPCPKDQSLIPQDEYWLQVEIAPSPGAAQVRFEFDESSLRHVFEREERVALDVVLFTPEDEFRCSGTRQQIWLPRVGGSSQARFTVSPQRVGWCRLRVAVYHGNALIQSVALQVYASNEAPPAEVGPTISRQLDWAASTDLLLLNELTTPVVSIFTNKSPDGSHWIGVFAGDQESPASLRAGQMRKLDSQDLTERTKNLREALQAAHGLPDYRYPAAAAPNDQAVIQFGIDTLIELAVRGREVFSYLFQGMTDISPQRLKTLRGTIGAQQNGIISIARCDARWTLPWSALYDYTLDVNRRQDLNVCSEFLKQLGTNKWDDSGQSVLTVNDLLSDPAACRAQSSCPLNGRNADVTVCPFGFWGFRNQIEEPLAQVTASREDEIPPEMKQASFSQSSLIPYAQAGGLRVAVGAYPFAQVSDHQQELEELLKNGLSWETDRDKVVKLLYNEQGHHLFYFYCHGVAGSEFAIQVGPANALHNLISQASLDLNHFHWAEGGNPQPLVILIACESVAARPETMHGLIGFLRNAMASGVVGSEITIDTGLGRLWGYRLISELLKGASVGECFLNLRHELLRRYNPLGLVFSMYAPAALHICADPAGKGRCAHYHVSPVQPPRLHSATSPL